MTPYIISQCENHTIQERKCLPTFTLAIIVNFNGFEETIADFQWFLRKPSPLNVFWQSDHCHQWFFNVFFILLPSLSMVFDGSGPLVKRCNGFDGSSWSIYLKKKQIRICVGKLVGWKTLGSIHTNPLPATARWPSVPRINK